MADENIRIAVDTEAPPDFGHDDEAPINPGRSYRRTSLATKRNDRKDHLEQLVMNRRASIKLMTNMIVGGVQPSVTDSDKSKARLSHEEKTSIIQESNFIREATEFRTELHKHFPDKFFSSVEVKVNNFSYKLKVDAEDNSIRTVYSQSFVHTIWHWMLRIYHREKKPERLERVVLDRINLVFKPGRMYLVLGNPGTGGKEALLKAIAGRLRSSSESTTEGSILYNGLSLKEKKDVFIDNVISYIDKIDFHAPRLTVKETFTFAFKCKAGGSHAPPGVEISQEAKAFIDKLDNDNHRVKILLQALGLTHVGDTFVGNADVRGVSGGQRRRVSIGEMCQTVSPVLCGDEISTGLDAAATFDICRSLMFFGQVNGMVRILSLLQPSPETVSLFDEVILMADGKILYAGPISEVEGYFETLGYQPPDQMDIADFLQEISTPGPNSLYKAEFDMNGLGKPYSMSELADQFRLSVYYQKIEHEQAEPWELSWVDGKAPLVGNVIKKYRNSFPRATFLNLSRTLLVWSRDRRFLVANAIKNIIMGVSVGGVFYQTDNYVSIFGVCFQINLFIMLGAMVAAPGEVDDRIIYYKHHDSNFYGVLPYVIGKAVGLMPQAFMDVMIFGTIIYWMVGFTASAPKYFIFIAILFVFSAVMNQMLSTFAAVAKTKTAVQGLCACVLLFLVVFSGFIVNPDVIPNYYIWIYWWNPLAWTYRAMLVNEFQSSEYDSVPEGANITVGDQILLSQGFQDSNGDAMGIIWVAWNFAYLVPYFFFCVIVNTIAFVYVRVQQDETGGEVSTAVADTALEGEAKDEEEMVVPVKPINLTFQDVCYDVKASKGNETIRLLEGVSGVFTSTRMVALMGSSGAGKTTLMDVIAMRKSTGTVTGQILINGFPQKREAFRRVTGYVEQFDVQSPELTVRETVLFSARLRLNSKEKIVETDESKVRYVDSVLRKLELTNLVDCLVGSDEEGGLSFEQRKRLSIAVELAASPSIIFLDEPTSGLDARAAAIVVRALRNIADTGRTVIATIHQPSLAVFEMFDELLLLKKGGRTVFFGELGLECEHLIRYFESVGADPIDVGENPANWMLKVITAEDAPCDYAEEFVKSENYSETNNRIQATTENPNPEDEVKFDTEYATTWRQRQTLTNERLRTIYYRSPAYNLGRIVISMGIAFILGSVYLNNRYPDTFSETQMSSIFATIFISFIITGVLAITSVLPVMLKLRDSFYRHRAAGMVGSNSMALGLGVAEKWFILVSSVLFCLIFIGTGGFHFTVFRRLVAFWGFFTFNAAMYSYFGQAFMCLVRGMGTAQILASVFIGINNFFSGLIVRPQYLAGIFEFSYWITPGHYVYEGMIVSLFSGDDRLVFANDNSTFYISQGCTPDEVYACNGTVSEYMDTFFGGKFNRGNLSTDVWVLTGFLIGARLITFLALKYFNYTST